MNNKSGSEVADIANILLKDDIDNPVHAYDNRVGYWLDKARLIDSHLQKLCEEQRSDNETLKNENELLIRRFNDTFGQFYGMDEQLRHVITTERERADKLEVRVRELDARVEEQKGEIAGWVSLVKQIGLKVNCLYSNFADDNGHILKAIDSVQSQLATQTERVKVLEEVLKFYRDNWVMNSDGDGSVPGCLRTWYEPNDELFADEGRKAEQALNQESLGDGK